MDIIKPIYIFERCIKKTYFSPFKTGSESINEEKSLFRSSLDNLTSSVRGFELRSCAT